MKSYIRYNWKKELLILLPVVLAFVTLLLEGVEISLFVYPTILVLFLWLVLEGVRAYKANEHAKELENVKEHMDVTLERLPEAGDFTESLYQNLLETFHEKTEGERQKNFEYKRNLEEFLTIWTHQIKTPLTALELAVKDLKPEEEKELSARLFEIDQYCDNMLTYLRIGGDGSDYVFEKQNVRSMVNESVKYFARTFISKGLAVKIEIDQEAELVTDEKWLVFALKQVLSNALKYTKEGTITIDMPEEGTIRLTDTGMGIAPEDLPRIMERGYTGYNGRIDKKATGMGLFLVKNIMEMLGGQVRIESELGKGTSVYLTIL